MENEQDAIELIDKYFGGELSPVEKETFAFRYQNDAAFRQEVEVYRKIYDGLRQIATEDELKKTLDHYYDKYTNDKVKPIGFIARHGWIITGLAASILLIAGVIWLINRPQSPGNSGLANNHPPKAHERKNDTSPTLPTRVAAGKPTVKPLPPDTAKYNSRFTVKDAYAMAGNLELPPDNIRRAVYPQTLSYTFNQGVLTLYGDPLIGLLFLDVYKTTTGYEMQYRSQTYLLKETATAGPQPLQLSGDKLNGKTSYEKVTIAIAALPTQPYHNAPIHVILAGGVGNDYRFTNQAGQSNLVLSGNFTPANFQIVQLLMNGRLDWLLVSNKQVFALDTAKHVQTPLLELSGLNSAAARLFLTRTTVVKTVLKEN